MKLKIKRLKKLAIKLSIKELIKKIRRQWLFCFILILLFFGSLGKMLITSQTMWQASLTNQTSLIKKNWPKFKSSWGVLFPNLCQTLAELTGLGEKQTINYTILLQNDKELRATGGFMGSFAQLEFNHGGLNDFYIEDVYVPDGKIQGHIEPPPAIQQAFQQGTWRLPDSNWYADFPKSAETINWFFNKSGAKQNDLLLAVNFTVLQDIFSQLEPVQLNDYQTTITADNLYLVIQSAAETDFFPGSTQKKDFLNQLSKNLLWQIEQLGWKKKIKIMQLALKHLKQKNIQIYSQNEQLQNWFEQKNWTGSLQTPTDNKDYLLIVDTNLGANKANCCTQRKVKQTVKNQNNYWQEKLEIEYINQSNSQNPQPPQNWGGDYENYLRVFLPEKAEIAKIKIDDHVLNKDQITLEKESELNLQSIGFFVNVPHQQNKKVEINYTLVKKEGQKKYQVLLQKQSGINYEHLFSYEKNNQIKEKKIWVEKDQLVKL